MLYMWVSSERKPLFYSAFADQNKKLLSVGCNQSLYLCLFLNFIKIQYSTMQRCFRVINAQGMHYGTKHTHTHTHASHTQKRQLR